MKFSMYKTVFASIELRSCHVNFEIIASCWFIIIFSPKEL